MAASSVKGVALEPKCDAGVDPVAAQQLQDELDAINAADPPDHVVPFFLASYRHPCARARMSLASGRGVSTNIETPEQYVMHHDGIHAMIYRQGRCKRCSQSVRSKQARVVLTAFRPPLSGRVARD